MVAELENGRYQAFLRRGSELFIEGRLRMTPDTLVVENEEGKVIAEFYREGIVGWKKAPAYGM